MEKDIIEKWDEHRESLKSYYSTALKCNIFGGYEKVVLDIIRYILNNNAESYEIWSEDIDTLNHGDYQGTLIFILHKETYQPPNEWDYLAACVNYGSCSFCDTYDAIYDMSDEDYLTERQVQAMMNLALNITQSMKYIFKNA